MKCMSGYDNEYIKYTAGKCYATPRYDLRNSAMYWDYIFSFSYNTYALLYTIVTPFFLCLNNDIKVTPPLNTNNSLGTKEQNKAGQIQWRTYLINEIMKFALKITK